MRARRIPPGRNGCLTRSQLLAAGLTPAMIDTRVRRGDLIWLFPRVYAKADPALIPWCRETAALLSLGSSAALTGRPAAAAWDFCSRPHAIIEVRVVGNPRPREGVHIRRVKSIARRDVRIRHNMRVTTPALTVIEFAATASVDEVEEAIARGLDNGMLSEAELRKVLARAPVNHPGAAAVRRLFERDGGPVLTRSDGERKLRRLLRAAGLPQPVSDQHLYGFEIDLYWPEYKLAVELDSYPFHSKRQTFERDRLKAQVLGSKGVIVIPLTGRQLRDEPFAVIARLAQVLVSRAA